MRKFTFSMIAFLAFALAYTSASAQQTRGLVYEDDFESYTVGDYIAVENPDFWTTWSGTPGSAEDAQISDEEASSGSQSVKVDGTTDLLMLLGNKTSGSYWVSWDYMVPTGYGAYYNFQKYEAPGTEFAFEVYFQENGTGFMNAGGDNAVTFNYSTGTWFTIENYIDLANDWAQVYFDGVLVYEWQYSLDAQGAAGVLQLGGIDFYAGVVTGSGETPLYYFDDISYESEDVVQDIYVDDFESYTLGDYIAVANPDFWTTWSGTPGSAEDALIVDEQASSPVQSVKVDGSTDLLLKLANKTSGKYVVEWMMYVPDGFGAYYNFQHFEAPGVEFAVEVYFKVDGTGYMHAGGQNTATFNFSHDTWFPVSTVIDLDNDWVETYYDDVLIYEWQWSLQSDGTAGTNQLGGVDFYAGADGTETPTYFFDDVSYVALVPGAQDPTIDINAAQILTSIAQGETTEITRSIGNTGEATLVYDIVTSYNEPAKAASWVSKTPVGKFSDTPVRNPNHVVGEAAPANRDVTLNYDSENASSIGSANASLWRVAAHFPASMVQQYNGMYITSVDVFINEPSDAHKIQVYDMGSINLPGPGALLYEQDFTPNPGSWNTVVLIDPVYVTGRDIYVGYWMDKPAEIYTAGVDAGPANPDGYGDWLAIGPGWGHLSDNPELDANWNIRAQLTGEGGPVWLSVNPTEGSLEAGDAEDLTIEVDANGLQAQTLYKGKLHVRSNDPVNQQIDISVWITVLVGLNEQGEQNYVSVYPNPVNDVLYLKGNTEISQVMISNNLGQIVYEGAVGQNETRIDISAFESGMYILTIQTPTGTATQKVMKQ